MLLQKLLLYSSCSTQKVGFHKLNEFHVWEWLNGCSFSDKDLAQNIRFKSQCFHNDQPHYVARVEALSLGKKGLEKSFFQTR